MKSKLICFIVLLLLTCNCLAVTEFVVTVGVDGTMQECENILDGNTTLATTQVFSHGGITGSIPDASNMKGCTSAATGQAWHVTATQIIMGNVSGTFQSGEKVCIATEYGTCPNPTNYVTLSNAGDTAAIKIVVPAGTYSAGVYFDSGVYSTANYMLLEGASADTTIIDVAGVAPAANTGVITVADVGVTVRQISVTNWGGSASTNRYDGIKVQVGAYNFTIQRCKVYDNVAGAWRVNGIWDQSNATGANVGTIESCMVWDINATTQFAEGIYLESNSNLRNCSVRDVISSGSTGWGIALGNATYTPIAKNNVCCTTTTADFIVFSTGSFSASNVSNESSDTTGIPASPGGGGQNSLVVVNQFVSATDLHVKDWSADIYNSGTDLGITFQDCDGNNFTIWSVGAHDGQNIATPTPTITNTNTPTLTQTATPTITATPIIPATVALYGTIEFSIPNINTYTNKFDFDEIQLDCVFTEPAPSVATHTFFGYYDGDGAGGQTGNIWKVRFCPDQVGTWSFTYSWSGTGTKPLGGSGTFAVTASANKGWLKRNPTALRGHHIITDGGEDFFWNGDTEWFILSDAITDQERTDMIAFIDTHTLNNLLVQGLNSDSGTDEVFPWVIESDPTAFDLTKMRMWENFFIALNNIDVYVDFWFYSDDDDGGIRPASGSAAEERYFKYMISRFGGYQNITWNLALEYTEYRTKVWAEAMATSVNAWDYTDRLLSIHQVLDLTYDFPGNTDLNHTALQYNAGTHSILNGMVVDNRTLTSEATFQVPIMIEEFHIEGFGTPAGMTDLQGRQGIWAIVTGGGYYKYASFGFWIGDPYGSCQHFGYADILYDFITVSPGVPWTDMAPDNSLVTLGTAYCLKLTDENYLLSLPEGGTINLNLAETANGFSVLWMKPDTGVTTAGSNVDGGGTLEFTPPSEPTGDWVLYLDRTLPTPTITATQTATPTLTITATPTITQTQTCYVEVQCE